VIAYDAQPQADVSARDRPYQPCGCAALCKDHFGRGGPQCFEYAVHCIFGGWAENPSIHLRQAVPEPQALIARAWLQ
jgi:hypothetical protein